VSMVSTHKVRIARSENKGWTSTMRENGPKVASEKAGDSDSTYEYLHPWKRALRGREQRGRDRRSKIGKPSVKTKSRQGFSN